MIHISHVALELAIDAPGVGEELQRRWASCADAVVATRRRARLVVTAEDDGQGGFRAHIDDGAGERHVDASVLLKAAETCIYDRLIHWHQEAGFLLLHAGLMLVGDRAVLLCGASGAGKSSICLSGLRRGWRYFTDDLTATDGERIWGVPRALQFDPVGEGDAVIERLADLPRFRWVLDVGAAAVEQPALVVDDARRATTPVALDDVHVVTLRQGNRDAVSPLLVGETSEALISAAYQWPAESVSWPGRLRPGVAVTWRDPDRAAALLEGALRDG